jgi:hypothetical protein
MADYDDEELMGFLLALGRSTEDVSEWEAKFISDQIPQLINPRFSDKQRAAIHRMIDKYAAKIKW